MGRKIHPGALRLGITQDWTSKWFNKNRYIDFLKEDFAIRNYIEKTLSQASVEKILIDRGSGQATVSIRTARPGLVIGRGGAGIEELNQNLAKLIETPLKIEIQEIRNPDAYASLVAQNIAEQIERRMPFRRVLKQTLYRVIENKEVTGVKVQVSGRLGGTDMSRREWLSKGKLPLQTLKADIDFAKTTAKTTYGAIGVKVWIYRENRSNT